MGCWGDPKQNFHLDSTTQPALIIWKMPLEYPPETCRDLFANKIYHIFSVGVAVAAEIRHYPPVLDIVDDHSVSGPMDAFVGAAAGWCGEICSGL